jgi:hypothetical protein
MHVFSQIRLRGSTAAAMLDVGWRRALSSTQGHTSRSWLSLASGSWAPGSKKRSLVLLAAAFLILLIILIVALAGVGRSKQRVLSRAFANLNQAQTFHTKAELDLNLPVRLRDRERPIVSVSTKVEGDVAYQDGTPALAGTLFTEARGRGMVLFADGDLRLLPNTVAFRLENLPALLNPRGTLVEKWTYVPTSTLQTNNISDVRTALANVITGMEYIGKEEIPGSSGRGYHYRRQLSPEQEDILINVFRQGVSGNRGLHILTRLMRGFNIASFDVWINPAGPEVRLIQLTFRHPGDAPNDEYRAIVNLALSDYDKVVRIDEPQQELQVRPEIFARIFGTGELAEL